MFLCSRSKKKKTVTLNLLWTRILPGSRSSVLCGKNTEGKTPYYSQTVAFRGCYCNDQHGITVGITVGFNVIFNSIYIYMYIILSMIFQEHSEFFLSPLISWKNHFLLIVLSSCTTPPAFYATCHVSLQLSHVMNLLFLKVKLH